MQEILKFTGAVGVAFGVAFGAGWILSRHHHTSSGRVSLGSPRDFLRHSVGSYYEETKQRDGCAN